MGGGFPRYKGQIKLLAGYLRRRYRSRKFGKISD